MRLYRGLKSQSFDMLSESDSLKYKSYWEEILINRSKGDFSYPSQLDKKISYIYQKENLTRQYFTDNR
jgi:hypothetical protein